MKINSTYPQHNHPVSNRCKGNKVLNGTLDYISKRTNLRYLFFVFILFPFSDLCAQDNYSWDGKKLVLDNGHIKRTIIYNPEKGSLSSRQILHKNDTSNLVLENSPEFSFTANKNFFSGASGWDLVECSPLSDQSNGKGASIHLKSKQSTPQVSLKISYLLYPDLAYIRKHITITNLSGEEIAIENLNVEELNVSLDPVDSWVYTSYAKLKKLGTYIGDWDDAVMMIHFTFGRWGIIVGNEIPGVMKRSAFNTNVNNLEVGYTSATQDFPFRKWIRKGESWSSHRVFTGWYVHSDNPLNELDTHYQDFSRRHLNFRINTIKEKPVFVYNTWKPFRQLVSDTLIRPLAKAAAECGVQEFVIDDGWQVNVGGKSSSKGGMNYGDWQVDKNKFPNGLKSTFDYIKSLGMKPGLWISIGSATEDAKVYKEHPEWFVKNYKNQPGNLHFVADSSDFYSSCLGTDWLDYIKKTILILSKDYGLAYAKLDLSVVVSAYVTDKRVSGCYATNHPYHKDHEESLLVLYDRLLQLFDDIHKEAPDLFIDCTFETAGKMQLMDLAISQHAEGNWLSNFEEPFPTGPLRVRQMAWWRSPVIPASALVIGNQEFESPNFDFVFKSLVGSLAIVLGDPRKLPVEKRKELKNWSVFLIEMQKKYNYMEFRQNLLGFGEPTIGNWDGWSRINTETKAGGLVGVFKQDARETKRNVFINSLEPKAMYKILEAPNKKIVFRMTGKQLSQVGFSVELKQNYGAVIYEIERE